MHKIIKLSVFRQAILLFLRLIVFCFVSSTYASTDEISSSPNKTPIKIGMSASLTGGDSTSGNTIKTGVQLYFDKINEAGGIDGRKLELIVLDDGYEPLRAAANLHKLIDQDHVLAIIGNNGTPAAVVAVPIVNKSKILLFGARTGSSLLRKTPADRYIINLRTSYSNEVNALIKYIISSGISPKNIAFFTQNDMFGNSIYTSAMTSLKQQGYLTPELLPHGRYNRNSSEFHSALSQIIEQAKVPIKAFILGGVYLPNAEFIKLASVEYPDALFLTVSGLINASDLTKQMNDKVISSQVVPYIDSTLPAVVEYRQDLKKYGADMQANVGTLEGYLVAKLFVMGLKKAAASHKLTREGIIDTFESMNKIDLGIGVSIICSKTDHSGIDALWITVYKEGKFIPLERSKN